MDVFSWPWALATAGGFVILGIAIGYAMTRVSRRTRQERLDRDAATRELYREDESESRGNWS